MMKIFVFYRVLLGLVLLLAAFSVSASWTASPHVVINRIIVGGTGHLYIYPENAPSVVSNTNPAGCTETNRFILAHNHEAYDIMYPLLLTASASGSRVRFNIYNGECALNVPSIRHIDVIFN